jgi:hypothetical protein
VVAEHVVVVVVVAVAVVSVFDRCELEEEGVAALFEKIFADTVAVDDL